MNLTEEWIRLYRAGDMDGANRVCIEPGNGHARSRDPAGDWWMLTDRPVRHAT